ncbi:MAG: carbohydrate binding family 9 domain-containing protein [Ignavibacteriaceae bacterium]|nr:carbohydrate binding family 9 domain-containing protein [Ignavibacteriaceae bacterium]
MKKLTCFILFLAVAIPHLLFASGNTPTKELVAVRLTEKISIDGILSEDIWKRQGYTELLQQEPNQGEKPSQQSEVWVAYDDDAIYFAAKYHDTNPDSILARLVRRDFVWGDPSDGTVLYIDSYGDKRSGYFFYVNAAGTLADGLLENDNKQTDLSWDAVWEGVPHIDKDGWSVEMRIPYSQLRFKPSETQVWGINVERFISRTAETDMIAYTPRNENGFASRFPELVGIEGITPPTRLEILPYVTGKAEYVGNDPNNPFNPGHKYLPGFGLDVRAGLGSSLTLNGTINPDFGQVEVDPAVVNLTDVETAFQEKRPFFTEGVNIFRFGNGGTNNNWNFNWPGANIFYSRRIGRAPQGSLPANDYADVPNGTHILGAAKISGRILNDWQIGSIQSLTHREFADIDLSGQRSSTEVEPFSYYGVFRIRKDFNEGQQGFGVLSTVTNRFFKDSNLKNNLNKDALVAGADGWTFLDNERTYVLTGWSAISRVSGEQNRMIALQKGSGHYFQRPDAKHLSVDSSATSLTGYAGRLMLNKNRGQFTINAAVGWLSPEFEVNDLGYGSYSDLINMHFAASYSFTQPTKFYQNAGINAATFGSFDFGGNKTAQGYFLGGYITFANLSGGNFSFNYNPKSFNARRTRGGPLTLNPISRSYNLNLNSDVREWWVLNLGGNASMGDNLNSKEIYANVEVKVSPTLTVQIGPDIARETYHAQWIGAYADPTAQETFGRRYLFARLEQTTFAADVRADWIISPTLSLQVYMQPLIVSGKYDQFKALQKSKTYDFLNYGENGSTLVVNTSPNGDVDSYTLDPDGTGSASARTIGNPDFNYLSLRGSAVLRWEYLAGSTLFFVWTQNRQDVEPSGEFNFKHSMNSLVDLRSDNIFLIKLSYWI